VWADGGFRDYIDGGFSGQAGVHFNGGGFAFVGKGGGCDGGRQEVDIFPGADDFENDGMRGNHEAEGDGIAGRGAIAFDGQFAANVAIGGVGKAEGFARRADFLRRVHVKEAEIGKDMATIETPVLSLDVNLGGLRKPELLAGGLEAYRLIVNSEMLEGQGNFRKGLHELRFQAQDLITAGIDPDATLKRKA